MKIGRIHQEICSWTDRQTDRVIAILRLPHRGGEVNIDLVMTYRHEHHRNTDNCFRPRCRGQPAVAAPWDLRSLSLPDKTLRQLYACTTSTPSQVSFSFENLFYSAADKVCPVGQEDEETVLRLLEECSALSVMRLSLLGSQYLSYEELGNVHCRGV